MREEVNAGLKTFLKDWFNKNGTVSLCENVLEKWGLIVEYSSD